MAGHGSIGRDAVEPTDATGELVVHRADPEVAMTVDAAIVQAGVGMAFVRCDSEVGGAFGPCPGPAKRQVAGKQQTARTRQGDASEKCAGLTDRIGRAGGRVEREQGRPHDVDPAQPLRAGIPKRCLAQFGAGPVCQFYSRGTVCQQCHGAVIARE